MVHELAHMWFGDSVVAVRVERPVAQRGPRELVRVRLRRGAGLPRGGHRRLSGRAGLRRRSRSSCAPSTRTATSGATTSARSRGRAAADADTLFSFNAYHGGALVLYALRQEIGDAAFERIERAWVARYRDGVGEHGRLHRARLARSPAATSRGFLRAWLYGDTTPPMPGHEDWTVDPVQELSPAARGLGQGRPKRR